MTQSILSAVPCAGFEHQPYLKTPFRMEPGLSPRRQEPIFIMDAHRDAYSAQKAAGHLMRHDHYFKGALLSIEDCIQIFDFVAQNLATDDSDAFELQASGALRDKKSEQLYPRPSTAEEFNDTYHRLLLTLQEDVALVHVTDTHNRLPWLHISFPNYWDPREKWNQDFIEVHKPVADTEALDTHHQRLFLHTFRQPSGFIRYAWGLSTDTRLDHHPVPPANIDPALWYGRAFTLEDPVLFARVERQSLVPIPNTSYLHFTIRTFFHDVRTMDSAALQGVRDNVLSMTPQVKAYKGMTDTWQPMVQYLDQLLRHGM